MTSPRKRKRVFFVEGGQQHSSPIPEGVVANGFVFLSAVRGVDATTQQVEAWDAETQTRRIFEIVKVTLAAVGSTMADIVKIAVYMKDINDRNAFNKVWSETFPTDPPARFAVQVIDMGLPGDKTKILVDVTALAPEEA